MNQAEIALTIPTTEIIRQMNQHETPPLQQLLPINHNHQNRSSESDPTIHILVFLYEIKEKTGIYLI